MNEVPVRSRGRPLGAKNLRTSRLESAVAQARGKALKSLSDPFPGDAHAYLMLVYKDKTQDVSARLDAAKAAIRYEKPALSSVSMNATVRRSISDFSDDELAALAGGADGGDGAAEAPGRSH